MKKFILLSVTLMLLAFMATNAEAQKKYPYGGKTAPVTIASAAAVSVTPYASLSQYEIAADHNITIDVVTSKSLPGDIMSFKIKANTSNRTITWGANIESAAVTITATKTVTYLFLWNGTNYYLCGSGAAD